MRLESADPAGRVVRVRYDVRVKGHVGKVLEALEESAP